MVLNELRKEKFMNRPYVKLNSKNIVNELLMALDKEISKIKSIDGILGITLNGGLSRGYADQLSEIDIVIYLHEDQYGEWQRGTSPIPLGIVKLNGYLYDIKVVALESEKKRSWDSVALWDLSYSKILFDPKGQIEELMKDKLITLIILDGYGLNSNKEGNAIEASKKPYIDSLLKNYPSTRILKA